MQAPAGKRHRPLRLLCFHGHGGYGERLCKQLESTLAPAARGGLPGKAALSGIDVECRCIDAPFPEPSRRQEGRQWWRYDAGGDGDRPDDWAEMEVAATRIAEELHRPAQPYDGVLGFSQGAEMVHTLAVLAHRGDPRFRGSHMPRFGVSLSGAVNPGHFEAPGGGGPPLGCPGPCAGPRAGELQLPVLFMGDFERDKWYPAQRFKDTLDMYADSTLVTHQESHSVPSFGVDAAAVVRGFLARFATSRD
mmetsp:Transcript_86720/g.240531  ORF Transcript_86720/g.240531 Transcript_86720/m.240531 type:complete len:249 (+) Transcript_86720:54-800(+)